ncbi:hypothetical protein [Burkholderia sp. Bp9004]|uniref:hypothetical protein n=1 Tax=Burkholderia sp. Bp9004 TaxID=2184559 RepID=UPI000F5F7173|nr:hypothetical protein [Burkholderia sp. Bp9004]RQZ67535.1 hypothetical protein DIE08_14195 [Burkholderia sp. Bp9004]
MLVSSSEYSAVFLRTRHLLLDSCILNDLATDARTQSVLERAATTYNFVYCAVSMLEVGFGPVGKRDEKQHQLARRVYADKEVVRLTDRLVSEYEQTGAPFAAGSVYSWTPQHHEWFAARDGLLRAMETRNLGGKAARELSNDAIIFFSAWNSRSVVITNNVKDFQLFNEVMFGADPRRQLPIYTLGDLERSLENDVSFPENLTAT